MTNNIVMIHGMWGSDWCWTFFKSYFEARGYNCHVPVLRHHDSDPKDTPPDGLGTASLLDYADDLEAYLQKFDNKPILMGHSMGGLLAQILAAKGLARTLVLLTPAPPAGIHCISWSVLKSFFSIFSQWEFWKKPHRISFEAASYAILHQLPESRQKKEYQKMVYESGRAAFEIGFWYLDHNRASRVDETKITCPALIVAGSKDRIVPAWVVRKIAEKYQHVATFKEFESHSHWLIGEDKWETAAACVLRWLENGA
ncbi:alpha/beta hydrolase [Desulfobacula toluolica]|uniref:Alpha/beta hydrolase fold protein n=1 Tax=Desulfobacula toluolica (strain DSM 7467 / Tol2) TaxID=651182 RepID=K0NBQ5_DESTT|nr:alpha/beta hydrolase [Desulfobacula toluolica]CCK81799.1 alpha/beta hydrolase fold protein [Desulfobacula toluolica Tol2]